MAARAPLVLVNGRMKQLPAGDSLDAALITVGAQSGGAVGQIRIEDATAARLGWTLTGTRRWTAGNDGTSWTLRDESGAADRLTVASNGVLTAHQIVSDGSVTGNGAFVVSGAASGNLADIFIRTGTANRWLLRKNSSAESGSDAGSDLQLFRYSDAGVATGVLSFSRATGAVTVLSALTVQPVDPTVNPLRVTGAFTGNGRTVSWANTDTSAGSAMSLAMASGATASGQVTQFGAEYTAVGAWQNRLLVENSVGAGVAYSALGASGNHLWTLGASRTQAMSLDSGGLDVTNAITQSGGKAVGHLGVVYANKTAAYTFTTTDRDRGAAKNTATAITFTLPTSPTAGDCYPFANINATGNLTIAAGTGGTCRLSGTTTTGSRTCAPWGRGAATCIVGGASPVWLVDGAGVT